MEPGSQSSVIADNFITRNMLSMPNSTSLEEAPPIISIVGANVRRLRKAAKLTQTALANKAGLHLNTINFIELARIDTLKLDTLEAIAHALEVDVSELTKHVGVSPAEPIVRAFLESPWAKVARVTEDEERWLLSIPSLQWLGSRIDEEAVYQILLARRRSGQP